MYDTSWVAATTNAAWMWYFSVYDFINFVTGREPGNEYAGNLFRRLVKPGSEHAEAVRSLCTDCQFPGERQKSTPCMTVRGLQRLLRGPTTFVALACYALATGHASGRGLLDTVRM